MKKYFLISWADNYADEFDFEGYVILTETDWKTLKKAIKKKKESFELYIETNEWVEYKNGKELLSNLSVSEISKKEKKVLENNLGSEFGFTSFLYLLD